MEKWREAYSARLDTVMKKYKIWLGITDTHMIPKVYYTQNNT